MNQIPYSKAKSFNYGILSFSGLILKRYFGILSILTLMQAHSLKAQEKKTFIRKDGQTVTVQIYQPDRFDTSDVRLALISPGAGGTENGFQYLAEALKKHGWLTVVLGHKESGPQVFRYDVRRYGLEKGLLKMTTNPKAYKDRFMDINATLKWVKQHYKPSIKALIGHSMGAATVMLEAGAGNKLGLQGQNQFDAYVALSPQGAGSIFTKDAWKDIRKPVLILTGTRDRAMEGGWKFRTQPYYDMPPGCKWLGVISDASHLNFAGIGFAHKTILLTEKYVQTFLGRVVSGNCGKPPEMDGILLQSK